MVDVKQVTADIQALKIQGATRIALAVLDTLTDVAATSPGVSRDALRGIAETLAYARPTEPLAQNAVRYVFADPVTPIPVRIEDYRTYIEKGGHSIPRIGKNLLVDGGVYLTLCHSSTTIALFEAARAGGAYFGLYVAETRPRFQGRTTAAELLNLGFDDVTMVVDDVAVSLLAGRRGKIDAVFIGADLLTSTGFVNKIGSLALASAARKARIPVYVLTTLLKYDPNPFTPSMIETRGPEEIWADAPPNLKFYSPAFDYVPYFPNIRVVCEAGIIPGKRVSGQTAKTYPFIGDPDIASVHYGQSV